MSRYIANKEKRGEKAHEKSIDIWEDIAEECAKFGNIVDMKIPKPQKDQQVPGCGLVSSLLYKNFIVLTQANRFS